MLNLPFWKTLCPLFVICNSCVHFLSVTPLWTTTFLELKMLRICRFFVHYASEISPLKRFCVTDMLGWLSFLYRNWKCQFQTCIGNFAVFKIIHLGYSSLKNLLVTDFTWFLILSFGNLEFVWSPTDFDREIKKCLGYVCITAIYSSDFLDKV